MPRRRKIEKRVFWQCGSCKKYVIGTKRAPEETCECGAFDFTRAAGTGRAQGRRFRTASGALYETQKDGSVRRLG